MIQLVGSHRRLLLTAEAYLENSLPYDIGLGLLEEKGSGTLQSHMKSDKP